MKKLILIYVYCLTALTLTNCSLYKNDEPQEAKKDEKVLRSDFFQAILNQDSDSLEKIVKDGADINAYDPDGLTGLMVAIEIKSGRMVRKLIQLGAKIYKPQESSIKTAFGFTNSNNENIKNLLTEASEKISKSLKNLIENGDFEKAFIFLREQYIPMDLEINGEKSLLSFTAKNVDKDNPYGKEMILYMVDLDGMTEAIISDSFAELNIASSRIKDTEFLAKVFAKIPQSQAQNIFNDNDLEEIIWSTQKLDVLNGLNWAFGEKQLLDSSIELSKKASSIQDIQALKQWMRAVYRSLLSDVKKNEITHAIFNSLFDESNKETSIKKMISLLEAWKTSSLSPSAFSADEMILSTFNFIQNENIDVNLIKNLIARIHNFSKAYDGDLEKSFKYLLSSDLKKVTRDSYFKTLTEVTTKIPEGMLGFAIENGGFEPLNLFLSSGLKFDASKQESAVLSSIESTGSGDSAKNILVVLKDNGISFNTVPGKLALLKAFEKMFSGDDTYRLAVQFLLQFPKTPAELLSDAESKDLISTYIDYLKENKKNWLELGLLVQKLKDLENAFEITETFGSGSKAVASKMSIGFKYLITAHEIIQANPSSRDDLIAIIPELVKKTKSQLGISSGLPDQFKSHHENLPSNILGFTLLMSIGKEYPSLPFAKEMVHSWEGIQPKYFNSKEFFSSPQLNDLKSDTDFWKKASEKLIQSGINFSSIKGFNIRNLIMALMDSNLMFEIPGLSELASSHAHLPRRDCVYPVEAGLVGPTYSVYSPTINILSPLIKKRKDGDFSGGKREVDFIIDTLKSNLSDPQYDVTPHQLQKFDTCGKVAMEYHKNIMSPTKYNGLGFLELADENNITQSVLYIEVEAILGNMQNKAQATTKLVRTATQDCVIQPYDDRLNYDLKMYRLYDWYKWAKQAGDTDLVNGLTNIKNHHDFGKYDDYNNTVGLCNN